MCVAWFTHYHKHAPNSFTSTSPHYLCDNSHSFNRRSCTINTCPHKTNQQFTTTWQFNNIFPFLFELLQLATLLYETRSQISCGLTGSVLSSILYVLHTVDIPSLFTKHWPWVSCMLMMLQPLWMALNKSNRLLQDCRLSLTNSISWMSANRLGSDKHADRQVMIQ